MPPVHEILVPLDGSPTAEASLDHARSLTHRLGARLHLVRVVASSGSDGGRDLQDPVGWRLERSDARSYIAEAARRLRSDGFEVEEAVLPGRPAEEIVTYARRHDVDLTVLSRSGAGDSRGGPMGGTAHKLVYRLGTSILLAESGPAGAAAHRRILVPVDGSPASEWALHTAASLLIDGRSELVATRVVEPGSGRGDEGACRDAEVYLERLCRRIEQAEMQMERAVVTAEHVARQLHALAEDREVDLVVLSAHGRSGAVRWPYGSVASNLLLHGRRPTLVLQDQPEPRRAEPPEREQPARRPRTQPRRPESAEAGGTAGDSSASSP